MRHILASLGAWLTRRFGTVRPGDGLSSSLKEAAPDLLQACILMIAVLDNLENGVSKDDPLRAIRLRFHAPLRSVIEPAIAKAEGTGKVPTVEKSQPDGAQNHGEAKP